jgi:hypothetical protein
MTAKLILAGVGLVFLMAAWLRFTRTGHLDRASYIWLLVTVIFAAVAGWLWWTELHS